MTCPPPIDASTSSARFVLGDRVRIDDRDPAVHHRVPAYVRGHVGEIVRVARAYGQPEHLAYGRDDEPAQTLYRVRLSQEDLWPGDARRGDTLDVEIFEHWLVSA